MAALRGRPCPFHGGDTARTQLSESEDGASTRHRAVGASVLGLCLEDCGKECLLSRPPSLWKFCYSAANRLRKYLLQWLDNEDPKIFVKLNPSAIKVSVLILLPSHSSWTTCRTHILIALAKRSHRHCLPFSLCPPFDAAKSYRPSQFQY